MANEIIPSEHLIGKTRSGGKVKVFNKNQIIEYCKKNNLPCVFDNEVVKIADLK